MVAIILRWFGFGWYIIGSIVLSVKVSYYRTYPNIDIDIIL